jgi:Calcineurin-like phosphoesterase
VWSSGKSRWHMQPPSAPDGVRIYAVGDVHGRADLLQRLLAAIDHDLIRYPVRRSIEVFLGDYMDRGPASREVLDILLKRGRTRQTVFLKGNHERYVTEFLHDPSILTDWRAFGGFETLMSYGVVPILSPDRDQQSELATKFAQALPQAHLQWLNRLRRSFICGDYFFVHAGVRPGIPLLKQHENDLLLIRDEFLLWEHDFSKVIVHGHTPVSEPDIRSNRINIDTGAYVTGQLTCLVLEREEMHFLRTR